MNGYQILFLMALSLILGIAGTYYVKNDADKLKLAAAVQSQINADNDQCNAAKKLTEDTDAKIHKQNAALHSRLHALLLQPAQCVPILSGNTTGFGTKGQSGQAGTNTGANRGLTTTWLYNYAGKCEADRIEMNSCVDFLIGERALRPVSR